MKTHALENLCEHCNEYKNLVIGQPDGICEECLNDLFDGNENAVCWRGAHIHRKINGEWIYKGICGENVFPIDGDKIGWAFPDDDNPNLDGFYEFKN